MTGIKIIGSSYHVSNNIINNEKFTVFLETSDEWIKTRSGISQRHLSDGSPTWLCGAKAAEDAVKNAKVTSEDIDMIICTTVTPDYHSPSMSCLIGEYLGTHNAFCMDINVACSGFVYALDMAKRYLMDDNIKNILVISSETLSQITDYEDRASCVLFGDGAGAVVVRAADTLFSSYLKCDFSGTHHIVGKIKRHDTPFYKIQDSGEEAKGFLKMNGAEVYKFATKAMPEAINAACNSAGITPQNLDLIVPHQANIRIMQTAAKNLGVSMDKVYVNIDEYGNTSSASIPIALAELYQAGKIRENDKICIVGFGAGLTYGAVVFTA